MGRTIRRWSRRRRTMTATMNTINAIVIIRTIWETILPDDVANDNDNDNNVDGV